MVTVTTISARLGWCLPACFIQKFPYKLNRCQKTSLLVIKIDVILGIPPITGSIRTRTIKTNVLLIHP